MVNALDEKAIFILTCHQKFDKAYYERRRKIDQLESDKVFQKNIYGIDMETNRIIAALERQNYGLTQYRKADYYGLTQNQFLYYKQILFSRGLFHDEGLGNLNVTPFDLMVVTELGYKFLQFIRAEN
ncbi:hypothetical protein [Ferruginibacter sp. HRS2-29]|uniref:hypothetical protein n=1 Tax=Ferruginibacter sp. HRS2-29 TaxID=2487334 RepID=UPI0020CEFD60|nr:hypothetical protein [Ferruginibacter sp. HRS2-29]MCP9752363.1 hypothetical protein [Ferruginibacter sp. HRS2-29]